MAQRVYDKEFKLNAIKMYKSGINCNQVCRNLGIPTSTFSGWIGAFNKDGNSAFPGAGNISDSKLDNYKLQKKLADAEMERDILKKALAIFSKQRA